MKRAWLEAVVRQAEALATGAGTSDADLLRRFAAGRDEAAFAELVRRHGPMVWAACRQSLPNPADAEDAFQATFLALVKSAKAIRSGAAVAGWLHGVAVRAAAKVRRSSARRNQRERRAAKAEGDRPVPESDWYGLLAAVHEEVQRLPAALRTAFVLCELEGVRQPDAAARLGWKAGTLTGRLARARQALLDRLAARGLAPAAAAGALGVGAATAGAGVPPRLVETVLSWAGSGAEAAPPAVLKLVLEVTPMVNRTKLLAAAVLVAGGLAAGFGPGLLAPADAQAPPATAPARRTPSPANTPRADPNAPATEGIPPAAGLPPGMPGGGGGGSMGGTSRSVTASGWEYRLAGAPQNPMEFAKLLTDYGADRWEFVGQIAGIGGTQMHPDTRRELARAVKAKPEQFDPSVEKYPDLLVFKRPRSAAARGWSTGGSGWAAGGSTSSSTPTAPGALAPPTIDPFVPGMAPGTFPRTAAPSGPNVPAGAASDFAPNPFGRASTPALTIHILPLKHAVAGHLQTILSRLLDGDPGVKQVISDDRTNSLILKATPDGLKAVEALLKKLDVPAAQAPPGGAATPGGYAPAPLGPPEPSPPSIPPPAGPSS